MTSPSLPPSYINTPPSLSPLRSILTTNIPQIGGDKDMQQAIPYSNGRSWMPLPSPKLGAGGGRGGGDVREVVKGSPVVVVGRKGCFMCHVVRRLLLGQGVNPVVYEVDDDVRGDGDFPAVFIGGRLVGGLDRLMAVHISGELVPLLKDAGALWL